MSSTQRKSKLGTGSGAAQAIHEGKLPFDRKAAVRHLKKADPRLGQFIQQVGPFALEIRPLKTPFAALARAIVYQQLSGKAAATIFGRVEALFPRSEELPARGVLKMSEDTLRAAGLSRNKLLSLKDLATKCLDGTVPSLEALEAMDDEEIIERLDIVRGVGRWTAEMFLMFRLGRPDVMPVDDLGIQKGFARVYGKKRLPKAEEMLERAEAWKPYRSVACWYLWRALEL
jgi:3-methyladenine DNA glycosylase/8-oxoguanine DNA glycosylase